LCFNPFPDRLKIERSLVPAGKGPFTHITLLEYTETAILYASPGLWNLCEYHFALGFLRGSLMGQWTPSTEMIKTGPPSFARQKQKEQQEQAVKNKDDVMSVVFVRFGPVEITLR
jgi:hypothetical protein